MDLLQLLIDNWSVLAGFIVGLLGALGVAYKKWGTAVKELVDIYVHYKKSYKDGWTAQEKQQLGEEVIEFVNSTKVLTKKVDKKE